MESGLIRGHVAEGDGEHLLLADRTVVTASITPQSCARSTVSGGIA